MEKKRKVLFLRFGLASLLLWLPIEAYGQAVPKTAPVRPDQTRPRLGAFQFRIRTIEASPSPLRLLEIEVEISNPDQHTAIPSDTITVRATPVEILPASIKSEGKYAPPPRETTLNFSIPPRVSRFILFGFSLPSEKLDSISFEVQINPPEGEKKSITYRF